jgi:acyl-CoA synthetase (AMP-forming)/AMP-acid ligase II
MVDMRASATPDLVLIVDEQGRSLTSAEFRTESLRVAKTLRSLGVIAGHVVSWVLPTRIDALILSAALARLGAVQNPIVPIYRHREIEHIVAEASVDVLIVVPEWRGYDYESLAARLSRESDGRVDSMLLSDALGGGGTVKAMPERNHGLGSAQWIFYSSGSTGRPKGAKHTDQTLAAVARGMAQHLMMTPADRNGIAFPIAHVGGPINLMASLLTGARMVLIETYEPEASSRVLAREGVTMAGSGTAFHLGYLEAQAQQPTSPLFASLRCCPGGGAPKPPGLHGRVKEELGGAGIVSGWGLTEAPVLTMGRPIDPDNKLAETEGTALPGVELRVTSAQGAVLSTGEVGELRARGPQVMLGYVDPALDGEVFDSDGYLRTGDLGTVDADGYVRITGRLKDVIIRSGENVAAAEVEDVLRFHPDVADLAVIGVPDPRTSERVCLVVELVSGAEPLDVPSLAEFLSATGLRRQAWPEQVEVVRSLPRTVAGKVDKAQLRELLASLRS